MKDIIAKMRADWPVVVADRRACGDWSDADTDEIATSIAAAIKANDENTIALWARWLADLSALALGLQVSGAAERIKKRKTDGSAR
jgi:hypothetical protein